MLKKQRITIFFLVLPLAFFCCRAEQKDQAGKVDLTSIDSIIQTIYTTITFAEGAIPNFENYRTLFVPQASFIRVRADGIDKMNLEDFISSFVKRIKKGEFKQFQETEIARKTLGYGGLVQVFSTYKKSVQPHNPKSFTRGINAFQLFFDGQRWWISSICWQDESPNNPIPQEYL